MAYFEIDGVKLFYEEKGDLKSEKVVAFFNGVMASTSSWNLLIPVFEKAGYRIILHDFKGQVLSDKPEGPYSFKDHATEAKELFDHLGVEKVHIIGTSYGSEVGMKFAILFPDMTLSLSLIDGVSELDNVLTKFIDNWCYLCELEDGEKFFWGMSPIIYGEDFFRENIEMLSKRAQNLKKIDPKYFYGQLQLYETFKLDVYMTDELHKIKCPTLIMVGDEDIIKPRKFSEIIHREIEKSQLVILPNCGHVGIFEKPEEIQTLLYGFIERTYL